MIRIAIDEDTFAKFGQRYRRGKINAVKKALDEIRAQWQLEFVRQQSRLSRSKWPRLKGFPITTGKTYYARKRRELYSHKHPEVHFLTPLKRSGRMLDGYIKGIQVNTQDLFVRVPIPIDPFGNDKRGRRALVHQGLVPAPPGVSARPFELDRFQLVGQRILKKALTKK